MPELPEVRALAERLSAAAAGSALLRADALSFTGLKTVAPDPASLKGRPFTGAATKGKYVLLGFGGPRITFHLSQGGRVDLERPPKTTRPKFGVARFTFEPASDGEPVAFLLKEFGTEKKAGWWVLAEGDDGPLTVLGPEPYDDAFATLIMSGEDSRRVHTILRDQRTVAGIGRGYSDDILHRAKISPFASLASLDQQTRRTLLTTIREMLDEGLLIERRRKGGLPTKIGDHWIVHGRYGERCGNCSDTLARVSYESHEVVYCPTCQTGGKVLADRRMSRLLK